MDFAKLEALRLLSRKLLADHESSLNYYAFEGGGFGHVNNTKCSVSSTATCVLSLTARSIWGNSEETKAKTKKLIEHMLSKRNSARLPLDNPFTTAWVLEAVTALEKYAKPLSEADELLIAKKVRVLQKRLKSGGVSMKPYPPSGYLTQLVLRALQNRNELPDKLKDKVRAWAWADLSKQLTLIQADSKSRDAFALAYSLIVATMVTPRKSISPEQSSIQHTAVQVFFDCQLPDGTWSLSRPLFHYPAFGNAYCYEYELLTELLQQDDLKDLLIEQLPKISDAVDAAIRTAYKLTTKVQVWASGHHPQLAEPESWSTASVYHFFYRLDRLLAEAVRRELFRQLELPAPTIGQQLADKEDFAPKMLDSLVTVHGNPLSLKEFLWANFVDPIRRKAPGIADGVPFDSGTPRSAIFFGPPGTSKTTLAEDIATFLGWPLLSIDPSMLLRTGMDGIQVEANSIFRMLEQTEQVVVLLDEFDELVRDRSDAEQPSRLLTTSMLPKLAQIHKAGTLVFIIATNNVSRFDLAIRRRGRFDRLIQVMPPTVGAKLTKNNWGENKNVDIAKTLSSLGISITDRVEKCLDALTFGECGSFASDLAKATDRDRALSLLEDAYKSCTLQLRAGTKETTSKENTNVETWEDRCKVEAKLTN